MKISEMPRKEAITYLKAAKVHIDELTDCIQELNKIVEMDPDKSEQAATLAKNILKLMGSGGTALVSVGVAALFATPLAVILGVTGVAASVLSGENRLKAMKSDRKTQIAANKLCTIQIKQVESRIEELTKNEAAQEYPSVIGKEYLNPRALAYIIHGMENSERSYEQICEDYSSLLAKEEADAKKTPSQRKKEEKAAKKEEKRKQKTMGAQPNQGKRKSVPKPIHKL